MFDGAPLDVAPWFGFCAACWFPNRLLFCSCGLLKLNEGAVLVCPEGGGPAGVVDGLPNEKPPLVLVVAGVVLPAWLDDAVLDAKLPNWLEPPALPALPKRPVFGAWPGFAESEDL